MPTVGLFVRDKTSTGCSHKTMIAMTIGVVVGVIGLSVIGVLSWMLAKRARTERLRQSVEPFPCENWRKTTTAVPLLLREEVEGEGERFDPNKFVSRSWTMSTTCSKRMLFDDPDLPLLPSPAPYLASPISVHIRHQPHLSSYDTPSISTSSQSHLPSRSQPRSRSLSPKSLPRLVIPKSMSLPPPGSLGLVLPPPPPLVGALHPNRPSPMTSMSSLPSRRPLPLPPGSMDTNQALVPNRSMSILSVDSTATLASCAPIPNRPPPLASFSQQFSTTSSYS